MAERKELRFFDNDRNYAAGLDAYCRWFAKCEAKHIKGEFSPTYLSNPKAPSRIESDLGNVKFIVCLRDPIERLKSHARHWIRTQKIQTDNLAEAMEAKPILIDKSKYFHSLQNYFRYFDRSQFYIILYEELSRDSEAILDGLYGFLGVRPGFRPNRTNQRINQGYSPRLKALESLKNHTHKALRGSRQGNQVINWMRDIGLSQLYRKVNNKPDNLRYQGTDIDKLMKEFEAEYHELPSLIGRDLSVWWTPDKP